MGTIFSGSRISRIILIAVVILSALAPAAVFAADAAMEEYCQVPPFIGVTKPNLLLMFDNSGSMFDLQYFDSSATAAFCFDGTFRNTKFCSTTTATTCTTDANCPSGELCVFRYAGYFDSAKWYSSAGVSYSSDITVDNSSFSSFTELAGPPPICTYQTPYLCIQSTTTIESVTTPGTCRKTPPQGTCIKLDCSCTANADCLGAGNACLGAVTNIIPHETIDNMYATGNFLNWLTASKMDVQKSILTGGKYVTKNCSTNRQLACQAAGDCPGAGATCDPVATPYLQGESRGCVGSRFVKEVPLADWTVISGANVLAAPASGPFSFAVRGDISADIRKPATGGTTRIDIFKGDFDNTECQDASNCWATCTGNACANCKNLTDVCISAGTGGTEATFTHSLTVCRQCAHIPCCPEDINTFGVDYQAIWGGNECGDGLDHTGLAAGSGKYICSNSSDPTVTPTAATFQGCAMNNYAGEVGLPGRYLGVCEALPAGPLKEKCTQYQFAYYCRQQQVGEVVDPTGGPADTATTGNLPAIVMDGGLQMALGAPMKTFHARVNLSTVPTGLINEFSTQIRFGGMKFNNFGSFSECTGTNPNIIYTCTEPTNKDGGILMSRVGDTAGSHATGLIRAIDDLTGATWTPFSEAMYNAIGYYAMTESTTPATAKRINSSDFGTPDPAAESPVAKPSQSNCQKNNVLLITDGQPTTDLAPTVTTAVAQNPAPAIGGSLAYDTSLATVQNACLPATYQLSKYSGSRNIYDLAWFGQHRKIQNLGSATGDAPVYEKEKVKFYTVFSGQDPTLLTTAGCATLPGTPAAVTDLCSPDSLMCYSAKAGGGTYYMAQDPASLKTSLKNAFLEIAAKATSGTAASVLASGEGSGANLIQALFYPRRTFDFSTETLWAGSLQNLWYYVDPFFANSNIREDTVKNGVLNLPEDYVVRLFFNNAPTVNKVQVDRASDSDGNGSPDGYVDTIDIENISSLWESGMQLWSRKTMTTSPRKIYTDCSINTGACVAGVGGSTGVMEFKDTNFDSATRQAYLGSPDYIGLISWVRGDKYCSGTATKCDSDAECTAPATCSGDTPGYRPRSVGIDLNKDGARSANEGGLWRLGDVLNSTPKIASWMPLNTFNRIYGDDTYGHPFADLTPSEGDDEDAFTTSRTTYPHYRNRGMAFAGANDGMLHAFRLGTLQLKWSGQSTTQQARLLRTCSKSNTVCSNDGGCAGDTCPELGKEIWAFIPKNALPYLKFMADNKYCHVYSVDLTPFIFDASIEGPGSSCAEANYWNCTRTKESWRTVLIGGMRYGGACKVKVCSVSGTKCAKDADCAGGTDVCQNPSADTIGTPALDPENSNKGLGYSSYFALDVTESLADAAAAPRLMWEFSNEELGLSSAAPAVVRIKALKDPDAASDASVVGDGRWFVVLGSGPTGPIDDKQMRGASNQNLKFFVLDLKDGSLQRTIDTGIANAFAGSMINSTFDSDLDYQDDVVYMGYVQKSGTTWTDGGVGRILTTPNGKDALEPANWEFSTVVENTGPVTSSVVKLQNNKTTKLWIYFGSGRYIYKTSTESDDNDGQRTLFGVTDPCFIGGTPPFKDSCVGVNRNGWASVLNNATSVADAKDTETGWFVHMNPSVADTDPSKSLGAERVITDPLATSSGMVFFTTFAPYADICTLGGKSYVWALKYDTAASPGAMLKGKALVQVSTGSIEQVDMATQFGESGGRKTVAMEGVPPTAQGLAIISSPPPVKRILHMKER